MNALHTEGASLNLQLQMKCSSGKKKIKNKKKETNRLASVRVYVNQMACYGKRAPLLYFSNPG